MRQEAVNAMNYTFLSWQSTSLVALMIMIRVLY